jgi:integrase
MLQRMSRTGVSGHLRVEERASKPAVWVATITDHGERRRVTLGCAWVKDSGKRTSRGAVVWRAAPGSKPDESFLTPAEAQAKLDEHIADARRRQGAAPATKGKTWAHARDGWLLEAQRIRALEATTLRGYRSAVNGLRDAGLRDELLLRRITAQKVEDVQSALIDAGLARKTVADYMRVARSILDFAQKQGWVAHNVAVDTRLVRAPAPTSDFRVLEPTNLEAVARVAVEIRPDEIPRYRGAKGREGRIADLTLEVMRERRLLQSEAIRLLAYTGLRIGELRVLRWSDIDIAGRTVRVPRNLPTSAPRGAKPKAPKSKRPRSLPLIDQALAALDRIEKLGPGREPEGLILVGTLNASIGVDGIRDSLYRGLDRAALGWMRDEPNPMVLHDLRHTFGTIAVRVFPLSDVQAYMGHADIQTTMRYVHHVPRNDAASRLSAAFSQDLNAGFPSAIGLDVADAPAAPVG